MVLDQAVKPLRQRGVQTCNRILRLLTGRADQTVYVIFKKVIIS